VVHAIALRGAAPRNGLVFLRDHSSSSSRTTAESGAAPIRRIATTLPRRGEDQLENYVPIALN
jgi:hypothetical protein